MASVDVSNGIPLMLPDFMLRSRQKQEPLSKPVAGLPLRRTLPMEVHSVLDYVSAGSLAASAAMAETDEARMTGIALAAALGGVSLFTDYDLSLAKLIPIEVHEMGDYLGGLSAIAAPFLFGYWKKDRAAAVAQVFTGISVILTSLFTDYRAATAKTWGGWPRR